MSKKNNIKASRHLDTVNEGVYTLSELKSLLIEADKKEFKAKKGPGVDSKEKDQNDKAVKEIMADVKKYNKVASDNFKPVTDGRDDGNLNKGQLDWELDKKPSKDTVDRIKSQVIGKSTTEADPSADTEGNEKFYNDRKKKSEERDKAKEKMQRTGLAARERDPKDFDIKTVFTGKNPTNETMKRLHFKNHVFVNESDVIKHVPEDYKKDGNKFYMKDSNGSEFLVECVVEQDLGVAKINVIGKYNKAELNEELDRMKKLYGYSSSDYFTSADKSIEGMQGVTDNIEKIRNISK